MSLDPASILASLVVSGVGFVLFSYGKRLRRMPQLATGIVMLVYPYFVPSAGMMLWIAGALLALLTAVLRLGI